MKKYEDFEGFSHTPTEAMFGGATALKEISFATPKGFSQANAALDLRAGLRPDGWDGGITYSGSDKWEQITISGGAKPIVTLPEDMKWVNESRGDGKQMSSADMTAQIKAGKGEGVWKRVTASDPLPGATPSSTASPRPGGSCDVSGGSQEVYRLYNPVTSEHLFTTDKKEYEALAAKHGWKQEGTAWVSPDATASSVGVYRLYNPGLGDHHYTKDQNEAAALVSKFGWVYDNDAKPLFYSDDSCQRVPVYRQYNGGLTSGQHHYTADENEAKALITKHGWKNEAIGWYAIKWR